MSLLNMGGQELDLLNLRRMQEEMAAMNQQAQRLGVTGIDTPQLGQQAPVPAQAPVQAPVQAPAPAKKTGFMQSIKNKMQDPAFMARLTAGLNSMRYAPSAGIAAQSQAVLEEQRAIQRGNQTAQQLRNAGRGDLADMIEASPENAATIYSAYLQQQLKPVSTFKQVSGAQLNQQLAAEGLPPAYDSDKVYNYDERSGKVTQIGTGDTVFNMPNLTESQGAATNFYNRARNAEERLAPFESQGTELGQALIGEIPFVGNMFQTPEYQVYTAIKSNFISAVLRKESGAAISVDEFTKEDKKYFPQVGDSQQVIMEKRRARQDAIEGLKLQAGEGTRLLDQKLPEGVTVKKKEDT